MTQDEYELIKEFIVKVKILVVRSQSYEVAAILRNIEKTLINSEKETLSINKYYNWINDVINTTTISSDLLNLLNSFRQKIREDIINKILENDTERT
ncbi:MAG TPA: hypothetical protein PKG93_04640 [Bacilli bacterium]|nr:hypothetical protein [Bacilli bacterium]